MSLTDHARAARIIGEEMTKGGDTPGLLIPERAVLFALGASYIAAASRMEAEDRDEAWRAAVGHACTFDHATMPTPTCPACKAPRKPK